MIGSANFPQERLRIYLLLSMVSLIFLRSIFGEFINLDDLDLVAGLKQTTQVNFSQLFFGENRGALYYRPLLISTYYLEKLYLAIDPLIMRLDNVLLQLANTLWVYLIIRKIYALKERTASWWPLLWALLFGLHPLATESVNWISGRTDLLAGFFILAATWLILKFRQERSWPALGAAFFCAFCAMLSKEVAIAFVPGVFLLLSARMATRSAAAGTKARIWRLIGGACCLAGALGLFVYLRSLLIVNSLSSISRTIHTFTDDFFYSAMLFFRLFGFYAKKIVAPWPLNLAITGVDPLYDLLGVVVVMLLIWLFLRHFFSTDFFVIASLLLLPAYPISFGQVAWTPYAERYAYVAVAFVLFACAALSAEYMHKASSQLALSAVLLLLLLFYASTTYARNGIWQYSLSLWADTVQKSPDSVEAHSNYGVALYKAGAFNEAEIQFDLARAGRGYSYSPQRAIIYGQLLLEMGRRTEAIAAWREVVSKTKGKSVEALSDIVTQCSRSAYMTEICGGYAPINAEFSQLYDVTSDPVWLVKWADFTGRAGQDAQSYDIYRRAALLLPSTHPLQVKVFEIIGGVSSPRR